MEEAHRNKLVTEDSKQPTFTKLLLQGVILLQLLNLTETTTH